MFKKKILFNILGYRKYKINNYKFGTFGFFFWFFFSGDIFTLINRYFYINK